MKRLLGILLFVSSLIISNQVFAISYGDIKDNNDGAAGQILVNTGVNSGSADIGTWVNPSSIPSLKGDQGDVGPAGPQGEVGPQGIQGETGSQGDKGAPGIDGIAGVNGQDGTNGVDGVPGVEGAKGDTGDKGAQGLQGFKGDTGLRGIAGKDVDPAVVNKINNKLENHDARINNLENAVHEQGETKVLIEGAVRLYDSKRLELQAFNSYDVQHGHNFAAGVRLLFKVGQSYEEKLIAKQQRDVEALALYVSRLEDQLAVPAPASIWFVSSNGEIQKTLPKDPAYIKALLTARKK